MARALRPIVLGGYAGLVADAARRAARRARPGSSPGSSRRSPPRCSCSSSRARGRTPSRAFAVTLLGAAWVGGGLALPDAPPRRARSTAGCSSSRRSLPSSRTTPPPSSSAALIGRHRLAPAISPGKSWEGFVAGTLAAVGVSFFALYEQDVRDDRRVARCSASRSASRRRSATCSSRRSSATWASRTPGACSAGTAACSIGSTRCSGPGRPRTSRCSR